MYTVTMTTGIMRSMDYGTCGILNTSRLPSVILLGGAGLVAHLDQREMLHRSVNCINLSRHNAGLWPVWVWFKNMLDQNFFIILKCMYASNRLIHALKIL